MSLIDYILFAVLEAPRKYRWKEDFFRFSGAETFVIGMVQQINADCRLKGEQSTEVFLILGF